MTERQILLVRTTWSYIIINSEQAGQLFYDRLFELAPELKPLFKGDIRDQIKKLMSTVTLIVTKLNKLSEIEEEVKALGARHIGYGTKPEHYTVVGQALFWTLKQGLRDKWAGEIEESWLKIYSILANAMMASNVKK